jgi:FkbM family methyltransferase
MSSSGFLYRRLAGVLPCVFSHVGTGSLSLRNKYDMASLRDVFMSAHYWRVFDHMPAAPKRVVDLGAHCGHFSVLCHLAMLERFGADSADYLLVEAMPLLIPQIHRVVDECGFASQVKIIEGLVGKKSGIAGFQTDPRNLLSSQAVPHATNGNIIRQLSYLDLDTVILPGAPIDVLKIDIEGSEFDLIENYPHLFRAAKLLLIEVHGDTEKQLGFERDLVTAGFSPLSPTIVKETERLLCYGVCT